MEGGPESRRKRGGPQEVEILTTKYVMIYIYSIYSMKLNAKMKKYLLNIDFHLKPQKVQHL